MSELWTDVGTVALARETPLDLVRSILQDAPDDTAVLRLDDLGRPEAVLSRHSVFTATGWDRLANVSDGVAYLVRVVEVGEHDALYLFGEPWPVAIAAVDDALVRLDLVRMEPSIVDSMVNRVVSNIAAWTGGRRALDTLELDFAITLPGRVSAVLRPVWCQYPNCGQFNTVVRKAPGIPCRRVPPPPQHAIVFV